MHRSLLFAASSAALLLAACGEDAADTGAASSAATEVSAGDVEAALARLNLAEEGVFTWDERRIDGSTATFTNLSGGDEKTAAGVIGELVITAPRLDGDVVMFDRVSLADASMPTDEGTVTMERFTLSNPGAELARAISIALLDLEDEPALVSEETIAGYSFSEITLEGLRGEVEAEGEPAEFTIERFSVNGFDGDNLSRGVLTGLNVATVSADTGPVRVSLDEMSVEALSGALILSSIRAAQTGEGAAAPSFGPVNAVDIYENFVMRGLDIDAGGLTVTMPELTAEITEAANGLRQISAMPSLRVAAGQGPIGGQLAGALALLGYEELNLSMRGESIYDTQADRVRTEGENFFELQDGLRIEIDQDVSGIQAYSTAYLEAVAAGDMENGQLPSEVLAPLTLHAMSMRIEDLSLLERGLNAAAAAQGLDAETLRLQAAGLVTLGLASAPAQLPPELTAQLGEAITGFIQNGGVLEVTMAPAEPVSVGALMERAEANGQLDLSSLGLSIRNEPPAE